MDSLVCHKSFLTLCVLYMQYHPDFLGESKYLGSVLQVKWSHIPFTGFRGKLWRYGLLIDP